MSTRQTSSLRPHPLIKSIPRWHAESPEWAAFVEDIRENGIKSPIRATGEGVVVDGWTRLLAAKALQFAEVPTETVDGAEAIQIILRELTLRRNLSKGALAYVAFPLIAPALKEYATRRVENLRKAQSSPEAYSVRLGQSRDTLEGFAVRLGLSPSLMDKAGQIHRHFDAHPDLRDKYETSILDPENPAGLGAVLAGIGFDLNRSAREAKGLKHRGGKPTDAGRQLELFTEVVDTFADRFEYWERFDAASRAAHWQHVRATVAKLPPERREALADYYHRLSETVSKA